jgi:hypothetical protein
MMLFAREAAMRILPWLFLNVQSGGMLALQGNAANAGTVIRAIDFPVVIAGLEPGNPSS